VVTAAGQGVRFGGDKMLHPVAGRPMLEHVLRAMPPERFSRRFVVLPPDAPQLTVLAQAYGFEVVINPSPETGLSSSVRLGLAGACAGGEPDGILFAVGDQPYLRRSSVERQLAMFAAHPQNIVALATGGSRGNPVLFPRHTYKDFARISGDRGGSMVMTMHHKLLLLCEAEMAEELTDIDRKDETVL